MECGVVALSKTLSANVKHQNYAKRIRTLEFEVKLEIEIRSRL